MPLRQRLQAIFARPLHLWLLLWGGVALLYIPAWKGGFEQDFEGWLYFYHTLPFWDLMNRKFAGIPSFYHVTQFQLYLLTLLFDVRPYLWFLLFTGLHALNGVQLYRLARSVMKDFGVSEAEGIAAAGTLLVLFNPSMTEAVCWKASYHYLVGLQAIFWSLIWARAYLKGGGLKYVWRSIILLIPLTFTLEIWYTIPVLVLLMALAYRRAGIISAAAMRGVSVRLILPQLVLLGLHLAAYRTVYGLWIAHSAFSSPGDDSFLTVVGRVWSYEFHLFGFGRFLPNNLRQHIYPLIGGKAVGLLTLLPILAFIVVAWMRYPRWRPEARVAALWLGLSLVSLGIILHFIAPDLHYVSNDRYLYFTAFFQCMLVAMGLSWLWRRRPRLGYTLFAGILVVFIAATGFLVMQWRQATKVFRAVQDKFVWQDAPVVLLLNLPSNYNGIGIIQAELSSEFPDHMYVFHKPRPRGTVYDVAGYNMQHPWDGAHVTVEDSTHITVTLNQWGTWWWRSGFGATDYETPLFSVHFTDPAHYYNLTLKKPLPAGAVMLYHQGHEWRVADMHKKGVEQW